MDTTTLKTCPQCHVQEPGNFCPHCGVPLAETVQAAPDPVPPVQAAYAPPAPGYPVPEYPAYGMAPVPAPEKKPKTALIIALVSGFVVLAAGAALLLLLVVLPGNRYDQAVGHFKGERYIEAFEALGQLSAGYKDVDELLPYYQAFAAYERRDYQDAARLFGRLRQYKDAEEMWGKCQYQQAKRLANAEQYDEALAFLDGLADRDSQELAQECRYQQAMDMMASDWESARDIFISLAPYRDSEELALDCRMKTASALFDAGRYEDAYYAFEEFADYRHYAAEMMDECLYQIGMGFYDDGDFEEAAYWFEWLGDYSDSAYLLDVCLSMAINEYDIYAEYMEWLCQWSTGISMGRGGFWVYDYKIFDFDNDGTLDLYYILDNGDEYLFGFCTAVDGYAETLLSGFGGPYGYGSHIFTQYSTRLGEHIIANSWFDEEYWSNTFYSMQNGRLTQIESVSAWYSEDYDYNPETDDWDYFWNTYYTVNGWEVDEEEYLYVVEAYVEPDGYYELPYVW